MLGRNVYYLLTVEKTSFLDDHLILMNIHTKFSSNCQVVSEKKIKM
jgi:hypothetical protein